MWFLNFKYKLKQYVKVIDQDKYWESGTLSIRIVSNLTVNKYLYTKVINSHIIMLQIDAFSLKFGNE